MKRTAMGKDRVSLAWIFVFLFCMALSITGWAETIEHKKVIVGYENFRVGQPVGDGIRKSGQYYENYQMLSNYTGWEYEYVYGSFDELWEKLKNGEIDLMDGLSYDEDRDAYVRFSSISTDIDRDFIMTRYDNDGLQTLEDIEKKQVGVLHGTIQQKVLVNFRHRFHKYFDIKTFNSAEELYAALRAEEIDAIYVSLKSVEMLQGFPLKLVGQAISELPTYFAVNKNRSDLYEELEEAMDAIVRTDPNAFAVDNAEGLPDIFYKARDTSALAKTWLASHDTLKVGYLKSYMPYSAMDSETGAWKGAAKDIIEKIFEGTDLTLEGYPYESNEIMLRDLQKGEIDAVATAVKESWYAEQYGMALTESFLGADVRMFYTTDENMEHPVIALSKQNMLRHSILAVNPEAVIREYEDLDQVFSAVRRGEADVTFQPDAFYLYDQQEHPNRYNYNDLQVSNYAPYDFRMCIGVQKGNAGLYDLLNEALLSMDAAAIQESMIHNSRYDVPMTLRNFIHSNPELSVGIIAAVLFVIATAVAIYLYRERYYRSVLETAHADSLTKLYNRAYGEQQINERIQSDKFRGGYLIVLDIDNFKLVNDCFGHQRGDEELIFIANTLMEFSKKRDVACRIGGDEFVLYLDSEEALYVLKRLEILRHKMQMNLKGEDHFVQISGSFGVVEVPKYGKNFQVLYTRGDKALYAAKQQGKNKIVFYREDLEKEDITEQILQKFDNALENRMISAYYQPIIRALSGNVCGFEALARWEDPERGIIPPNEFIPVLEAKKQIHRLDLYIVEEICRSLHVALSNDMVCEQTSFNLSRYDFIVCDIFTEVNTIVEKYKIPKRLLAVEITESLMMENPKIVQESIAKFHQAGYQVWMDDFGSGYSSLNVLKNFAFDEIKMDMVFLKDFDERSKKVVTSIISMAKKLGTQVLAEGVETEEQYNFLMKSGCEKLQGYFLGRPMPMKETLRHCRERGRKHELPAERICYEKIGKIDFLTERPLAVTEYHKEQIAFTFTNDAFHSMLVSCDILTEKAAEALLNEQNTLLYQQVRYIVNRTVKDHNGTEGDIYLGEKEIRVFAENIYDSEQRIFTKVEIIKVQDRR